MRKNVPRESLYIYMDGNVLSGLHGHQKVPRIRLSTFPVAVDHPEAWRSAWAVQFWEVYQTGSSDPVMSTPFQHKLSHRHHRRNRHAKSLVPRCTHTLYIYIYYIIYIYIYIILYIIYIIYYIYNNIHMHIFGSIRILRVYAHISNRCICAHVRSCSGGKCRQNCISSKQGGNASRAS